MKSRDKQDSYSQWRKDLKNFNNEFTLKNSYCLDVDFIEYTFINNEMLPYLIIEVTEPAMPLEACTYYKNVQIYKEQQVKMMKILSKALNIPWIIVLSRIEDNVRKFKIYGDKRMSEAIYSESDYIKLLSEFKQEVLNRHRSKKNPNYI